MAPSSWQPYSPFGELPDMEMMLSHINRIAREVANKFEHSDPYDLSQAVWLWMGEFPAQSAKWWYDGDDGTETDTLVRKFSMRNFLRDVKKVQVTYARRDRAAAIGYETEDECYYSRRVVERYMPYVWHSEVLAQAGEVNEGPSAKVDPAKGGDALASAMDVRAAYEAVITEGSTWHKALFLSYGMDWDQQTIADEMGVTQQSVSKYLKQAVQAMAEHLNGPEMMPGMTLKDGPGSRKARSNATAQAILD